MKKIVLAFTLLLQILVCSDRIQLRSGEAVRGEIIKTEDGFLYFISGEKFPLEEIKEIGFGNLEESAGKTDEKASFLKGTEKTEYSWYFRKAAEINKKYPGCDYIHIIDEGFDMLNRDGTRVFRYKFLGYVNTSKAKSDFSKFSFYIDEERIRSRMVRARAIYPDGRVYNCDPDVFEIVKPQTESWSYGGSNLKVMTIPNVDIGTLVEYEYEITSFNPYNRRIFETSFFFQGKAPSFKTSYTVAVPYEMSFTEKDLNDPAGENKVLLKDVRLNWVTYNMSALKLRSAPVISNAGGHRYYKWEYYDIPPFVEEPYAPDSADLLPNVQGTIFFDRTYLDGFFRTLQNEKMQVTPEIRGTVNAIVDPADGPEIKLAKVYHWIQRNIIYLSVKGSVSSGLTGHPAIETLRNRKGDCIDKAILFATMIDALEVPGLKVYPVSIKTNDIEKMVIDIPVIDANHAITEVHYNGKIFYLDGTAESYRYPYFRGDDKGVPAVNEMLGTVRMIPVPAPEDEMNYYDINLTVLKNGKIKGATKAKYTGDYEARLRGYYMAYSGIKERKDIFASMVNSMSPKGVLKGYGLSEPGDFLTPFELSYSYELFDHPTLAGDFIIFNLPGFDFDFPEIELSERKYPLEYTTSRYTGHSFTVNIPRGYSVEYLPSPLNVKTDDFEYSGEYTVEENRIIFRSTYKRFTRIISPEAYPEFRQAHLEILNYCRRNIIIKRK